MKKLKKTTFIPNDILFTIFSFLEFKNLKKVMVVSKRFNDICDTVINQMFNNEPIENKKKYLHCKQTNCFKHFEYPVPRGYNLCSICRDVDNDVGICWECDKYICSYCMSKNPHPSFEERCDYCIIPDLVCSGCVKRCTRCQKKICRKHSQGGSCHPNCNQKAVIQIVIKKKN